VLWLRRRLLIPDFTNEGLLPGGIHWCTWKEFIDRYGWSTYRMLLITGLKEAISNLHNAGCPVIYINGSFVTDREIPNDFDCCWEVNGVDPNRLDPVLLDFRNMRAAQKMKYMGELFPSSFLANTNNPQMRFLEFFQQDKATGLRKGIVAINITGWKS